MAVQRRVAFKFCQHCDKKVRGSNIARHEKQCLTKDTASTNVSGVDVAIGKFDDVFKDTRPDLKDFLMDNHFATLEDMTDECSHLWSEAKQNLPVKFPAAECWRGQPPRPQSIYEGLIDTTYAHPEDLTRQVFPPGSQVSNVLWQMSHPDASGPVHLMNIMWDMPSLVYPAEVVRRRLPYGQPMFAANLTPKYTVVDLHIDQLRDGLVMCIGRSQKIIAMWPGTKENMEIMTRYCACAKRFALVGKELRGGIITVCDSKEALFFEVPTIHMTITLEGGVLVGLNSVSPYGLRQAVTNLEYEIDVEIEDRSNMVDVLCTNVEACLESNVTRFHDQMLELWPCIRHLTRERKEDTKSEKDRMEKLHRRMVGAMEKVLDRRRHSCIPCCPATSVDPDLSLAQFAQHYREDHLYALSSGLKRSLSVTIPRTRSSQRARH